MSGLFFKSFRFETFCMILSRNVQKISNLNILKNGPVIKILYDNMKKCTLFLAVFLPKFHVDQLPLIPSRFKYFFKPRLAGNQNRYSGKRISFV